MGYVWLILIFTNKVGDSVTHGLDEEAKTFIRNNLSDVLIRSERKIGLNLTDIGSVCGNEGFTEKWPKLIPTLVGALKTTSQDSHFVALTTMKKLLRKYLYIV